MRGDSVVKSAGRVLEIFEYFSERKSGARVGDISRVLGYPQSSTSVLMKSLHRLGYLVYDPETRLYSPTVRIVILGGWLNDWLATDASITKLMEDLRRKTRYTILLGVQNGTHVQYVSILLGTWRTIYIKTGTLRPICRAATGKILLSLKSEPEIRRLVLRCNIEAPDHELRVDSEVLLAEMAQIRRDGYARSLGGVQPGRDVIAMQLPMPPSQPKVAIGIGGPQERTSCDAQWIIDTLNEALEPFRRKFHASSESNIPVPEDLPT